jgi:hypothetical protein
VPLPESPALAPKYEKYPSAFDGVQTPSTPARPYWWFPGTGCTIAAAKYVSGGNGFRPKVELAHDEPAAPASRCVLAHTLVERAGRARASHHGRRVVGVADRGG